MSSEKTEALLRHRITVENIESGPRHCPSSGDEKADYLHLSGGVSHMADNIIGK